MENERTITLTWLDRHYIRYALLAEVDRLKELRDDAIRLGIDTEEGLRAIDSSINEKLRIIEKLGDKG